MRKMKIFGWLLLVFLVFSSQAFSAEKIQWAVGGSAGMFGGAYAVRGEVLYRLPKMYGIDNIYLRVGLGIADTNNVANMAWRKFVPLCVDGIMYLSDNVYVGGGLNYPLKISDGLTANWGAELFLGADMESGPGKVYLEAGYSALRAQNQASFKGIHALVGYRYDLEKITVAEVKKVPEVKPPGLTPIMKEIPKKMIEVPKVEKKVVKAKPKMVSHCISAGETLAGISQKYYGTPDLYPEIAKANKIKDPGLIIAGEYLEIDLSLKKK